MTVFAVALLGGFSGTWLASPTPAVANSLKVMEVEELRLTDHLGRTRLLLTLLRDKPRLFMLDDDGEYRLEMGLGMEGEPHLWLRDQDGAAKIQVSLTPTGRPAFRLLDQKARERATLALSEAGDPTMILRNHKGQDRLALWQDSKETGLALADNQGNPIVALSAPDQEPARLSFFNETGQPYKIIE